MKILDRFLHCFSVIKNNRWALLFLPQSIIFNFRYLPFKKAKHLPILLRKPKLHLAKGSRVIIQCDDVYFGMIKLGYNGVSIYEDSGINLDLCGKIIFHGPCMIGNQTRFSVGDNGVVEFGRYFYNSAALKIVCYSQIIFENNVDVGWNSVIMDNDFHQIKIGREGEPLPLTKEIIIGHHSWLACNCTVMKGTVVPPYSIFAANSLLNKDYSELPEHTLFAGIPAIPKKEDVWRA